MKLNRICKRKKYFARCHFYTSKIRYVFFESFLYIEFEAWQKKINIFQAYRLCPTQQR